MQITKMTESVFNRTMLLVQNIYTTELLISGEVHTQEQIDQICHEHIDQVMYRGFTTPDHHLFTLFKDQQDIGFLWYGFDKKDALLYFIYIHPDYRRQGYAQMALDFYHQQAKQSRKHHAKLHVFQHNPGARKLYQKNDYKILPHAYKSPFCNHETRYRMAKSL